ncbi:MAG: hypothetical protein JWP32_1338 [Schumannella sp.]|nr:hypothetical protein [Schumannella sp.]
MNILDELWPNRGQTHAARVARYGTDRRMFDSLNDLTRPYQTPVPNSKSGSLGNQTFGYGCPDLKRYLPHPTIRLQIITVAGRYDGAVRFGWR